MSSLRSHLITLSVLCALCAPALAQQAPGAQEGVDPAQEFVRASMPVELGEGSRRINPTLILHRSRSSQGWRVTVQQDGKRKQELTSLSLVEWAGNTYYTYDVSVRRSELDNHYYVLFEAIPGEGAPPAAATLQLLWLVETPRRGDSRWKYVTRAQSSDLDGGESMTFEARDAKSAFLVRRRPQLGSRFCGISSDEIFEKERYSAAKGIFVMELDLTRLALDADPLQAFLPRIPFAPDDVYGYSRWLAATSDFRTPTDLTTVLRPLELGDGLLETVWAEGAPDMGRGEFVSAQIEGSLPLTGFRIFPGSGESAQAFAMLQRPKKLLVGTSDGARFIVDIPRSSYESLIDKKGMLVEFASPIKTRCLSVLILDAYASEAPAPRRKDFRRARNYEAALTQYSAVAIAEITPISILQGLPPTTLARTVLEILYDEPDAAQRRKLGLMTRAYSPYIIEALRVRLDEPGGLDKLDHVASLLSALPSQESVPLLISLIDRVEPRSGSWRSLRRALASHQRAAAPAVLKALRELPLDAERKRTDLIRLYGRVAQADQLEALLENLGEGGELERNERVRALASGGKPMIPALLQSAAAHLEEPAGEDALKALDTIGRRVLIRPELTEAQQEEMLSLAERASLRRSVVRALHLLDHYQPRGTRELLATRMLVHRDPIVRVEAARALRTFSDTSSREALEGALQDPSPSVRIAAIRSLRERKDSASASASVLAYVENERWSDGLEPALLFLAALEDEAMNQKLEAMILDRSEPRRAYLAAQAFERARQGISTQTIQALLFEDATSFEMRRQLVELLGRSEDPDSDLLLIRIIKEAPFFRQEDPRRVEVLTRAAILSLGLQRSERGKPLLLDIVRKEPSFKLQRAALRALSFYKDTRIADALGELRPDAAPGLQQAIDDARQTIKGRSDLATAAQSIKDFEEQERLRREERERALQEPSP